MLEFGLEKKGKEGAAGDFLLLLIWLGRYLNIYNPGANKIKHNLILTVFPC